MAAVHITSARVSGQPSPFAASPALIAAIRPLLIQHGERAVLDSVAAALGLERVAAALAGDAARPANENDAGPCHHPVEPAGDAVVFYEAGCDGLQALAGTIGHPILKKGYCATGTPQRRMAAFGIQLYGAFHRDPADPQRFVQNSGFETWRPSTNRPCDFNTVPLPPGVTIVDNAYRVALPAAVDPEAFDGHMTMLMQPKQLDFWAQTAEGRAACAVRGVDPNSLVRYWRDPATGEHHACKELYAFHPRRDRAWFAGVIAQALATFAQRAA